MNKILQFVNIHKIDIMIAVLLGIFFAFSSFERANRVPTVVFEGKYLDIWFESDSPRVFKAMTDRSADHSRAKVHPLFALTVYPLVYVTEKFIVHDPVAAVRLVISAVGFLWMIAFFAVFRLIGCRTIDAVLLCLVAAYSAAGMFFFVVPETYPFGSLTLLLGFLIIIVAQKGALSNWWGVMVNVITISITTSNWMLGLCATAVSFPINKGIRIVGTSMFCVAVLWYLQKLIFPTTGFLLDFATEKNFILREESIGPLNFIWSFFYHTLIMPEFHVSTDPAVPGWAGTITQPSIPGSGSLLGRLAVIVWTPLMAAGIWSLLVSKGNYKLRLVIGLTLGGQFLLHLIYGFETFLYSLHFIVFLLLVVSLITFSKYRILVSGALVLLLVCLMVNNSLKFDHAIDFIKAHYTNDLGVN